MVENEGLIGRRDMRILRNVRAQCKVSHQILILCGSTLEELLRLIGSTVPIPLEENGLGNSQKIDMHFRVRKSEEKFEKGLIEDAITLK